MRLLALQGRGLFAALLFLAVGASFGANSAHAHAVLMDSAPKAGEMLPVSPPEVSVTFNEGVGPIFFKILDRTGKEVGKPGEIKLDGTRMVMSLGETLPNGTYVLTYRVISADTHPVGSTFGFSIGEPMADTLAMTAAAPATSGWTYAVGVNRWILYATMLLAAGSALFVLLLNAVPAVNRVAFDTGGLAAWFAIAAYLLSIGFGGAEMLLGGAGALFSAEAWSRGLASTLTPSAAIGVPAMLLLIWAFRQSADAPRTGALGFGAALAVASFLVTGHAATAPPVWLLATTVAVHLTCTSFWLGSLRPLWRSTELVPLQQSGALLTQFSTRAVWAVGAIVVSGLVISWTQVQSIESLFGNPYGTALQRKLLLFVVLLGLAAYNKFSLTPALERGAAAAAPKIRRTIRIEFFIYLLILVAAMLMTVTTPPRSIAPAGTADAAAMTGAGASGSIKTSATASGYVVDIELSSDRAGENMLMATVKDAEGKILEDMADLELVLGLPAAGIQDVRIKAEKMPNGMWHAMIAEMIIPGEWQIGVEAFVTDYDKVEFASIVQIR